MNENDRKVIWYGGLGTLFGVIGLFINSGLPDAEALHSAPFLMVLLCIVLGTICALHVIRGLKLRR